MNIPVSDIIAVAIPILTAIAGWISSQLAMRGYVLPSWAKNAYKIVGGMDGILIHIERVARDYHGVPDCEKRDMVVSTLKSIYKHKTNKILPDTVANALVEFVYMQYKKRIITKDR